MATLILTDSCWVNDNRNPGIPQDEIENELKTRLGVHKVIWLPGVRGEDITDGHIDGLVRFVRPGVLATDFFEGGTSPWVEALTESKSILRNATDAKGRTFEMVDIPVGTGPALYPPQVSFPAMPTSTLATGRSTPRSSEISWPTTKRSSYWVGCSRAEISSLST